MNFIPQIPAESDRDPYFKREWQKMLDGEIYDAAYPPFAQMLLATRRMIKRFNDLEPDSPELRSILRELLGHCGDNIIVNQPFHCDYGCNISVGDNFMANFNLTILDEAVVSFGNNCFIGPNVSIYTACHPTNADERRGGAEWAEPVIIGNDVWIGGGTNILPGVTIGDRCVIGAGSVVVKDIPSDSIAAGNPARVIRRL